MSRVYWSIMQDPESFEPQLSRCGKILASGPGGVFRCTDTAILCNCCGYCIEDRDDYSITPLESSHCKCTLDDMIAYVNRATQPPSAP